MFINHAQIQTKEQWIEISKHYRYNEFDKEGKNTYTALVDVVSLEKKGQDTVGAIIGLKVLDSNSKFMPQGFKFKIYTNDHQSTKPGWVLMEK